MQEVIRMSSPKSGKIQAVHLQRRAYVYIRQSTTAQVIDNKESTVRQYALAERAIDMGWQRDAIEIIDEDLGRSGATTEGRTGFSRLAEGVAQGMAGAIFALEVSRLARSSQDWQRLLALCAVAQVVVCDENAIYDPQNCDDKLLLDLKGTMSEVELHWLSLRMAGARQSLARRGALRFPPSTGYLWGERGLELDPDEAVRHAIATIFERFAIEPSQGAVLRWARKAEYLIPTRRSFADGTSTLTWDTLCSSRLNEIIHNPIYAGAYAYGRRSEKKTLVRGEIRTIRQVKAPNDWLVLIKDAHPGYISWEVFMSNQEKMAHCAGRTWAPGAPREGRALLSGILICGRCGRRFRTAYQGRGEGWTYVCSGDRDRGALPCWTVRGQAIDAAVEDLFLRMVIPSELDITLAVEREAEAQAASLHQQWKLRLEKAEYEARRAERRYKAIDPENRVVARTLESEWEACLRELESVKARYEDARREHRVQLTDQDRARIRALARDLPAVWRAPTTQPEDRKAMLRIAIECVAIRPIDAPERLTHIRVQWRSGAVDELTAPRSRARAASNAVIERIRKLAGLALHDEIIAERLNAESLLTGARRPWDGQSVKRIRLKHAIPRIAAIKPSIARVPDRHPDGRYSVNGIAKRFGVSEMVVYRWIRDGIVSGVREAFATYKSVWWFDIDDAAARRLEQASAGTRGTGKRKLESTD